MFLSSNVQLTITGMTSQNESTKYRYQLLLAVSFTCALNRRPFLDQYWLDLVHVFYSLDSLFMEAKLKCFIL